MNEDSKKINTEDMKRIFGYLIEPVVLEIDKEIEDLKIPEGKDFL